MDIRIIGDWVFREKRPEKNANNRLLLMLHGWTGDENSMTVFAKAAPANYWLVAPRGIYQSDQGGYSWFREQGTTWPWVDDFRSAMEALLELLTSDIFPEVIPKQVDVMGFSQGAGLAYALAFLYPQKVRKIAGLAGFLPEGCEALARNQPLQGKKVFVAHGRLDELVPVEMGRHCAFILKEAGGEVEYCEDDVGHKLSKACFGGLKKFFKPD
jgi:phospholipase/carboxylesterase